MKKKYSAYLDLTKPRILSLVLVTTALGFYLGGKGVASVPLLFFTLLGTGLVCAGASALNHYLERDSDGKMHRTKNRPIPMGIIAAQNAMMFGIVLILIGVFILYWRVNLLTAFLSLLAAFLYVLVYTPMKKLTWLNTTIGAIPGAIPPMGGWAAATGELQAGAWILFLILFAWQHPHFYAIAWMFKDDYARGGFKMLPVVEPSGKSTFFQIILFSLLLTPISLLPSLTGLAGQICFIGAFVLSILLLLLGISLSLGKSINHARRLLRASVIYLPFLFSLIAIDAKF